MSLSNDLENDLQQQLFSQISELKGELDKYKTELAELRSQIASGRSTSMDRIASGTTSRRRLLKGLAAGMAGVGLVSLAGSSPVVQAATQSDIAIDATGGTDGYGAQLAGTSSGAQLRLVPAGVTLPSISGRQVGELFVDSAGSLYYATGTPGSAATGWRQISGSNTAGVQHFLPTPVRVIDTRDAASASYGKLSGYLGTTYNGQTVWSLAGANPAFIKSYTIGGVSGIPSGAIGVSGNLAVVADTNASYGGFLSVWPYSGTLPTVSTINYSNSNNVVANHFICGLTSNKLSVAAATNTHVIIDITGYYL